MAEVFDYYKWEYDHMTLYSVWMEGKIIIRPRTHDDQQAGSSFGGRGAFDFKMTTPPLAAGSGNILLDETVGDDVGGMCGIAGVVFAMHEIAERILGFLGKRVRANKQIRPVQREFSRQIKSCATFLVMHIVKRVDDMPTYAAALQEAHDIAEMALFRGEIAERPRKRPRAS